MTTASSNREDSQANSYKQPIFASIYNPIVLLFTVREENASEKQLLTHSVSGLVGDDGALKVPANGGGGVTLGHTH